MFPCGSLGSGRVSCKRQLPNVMEQSGFHQERGRHNRHSKYGTIEVYIV